MKMLVILVIALSVAGCAQKQARLEWFPIGTTNTDFNLDRYECERDMRTANFSGAGNREITTGKDFAAAIFFGGDAWARSQDEKAKADFFVRCMNLRGWEARSR